MQSQSKTQIWRWLPWLAVPAVLAFLVVPSLTQSQPGPGGDKPKKDVGKTSYDQIAVPVLLGQESFATMMARDKAAKAAVMERHTT